MPHKTTPKEEDTELVMKKSIAEAVAAARAEEAQRQADKWEREREKIIQEAEEAARSRVESDLSIQKHRIEFENWKRQVEAERAAESNTFSTVNPQETTDSDSSDTVSPQNSPKDHPILGPCVLDLGYKRIYTVSASALANIPVWKKQRIYRHDRAKMMALDKQKTMHLGVPGIIGLHEDLEGQLCILDGQHRVGMFTILGMKDKYDVLEKILVEVYPQTSEHSENHAQELVRSLECSWTYSSDIQYY
jgi:hypothetical protein